MPTNPFVRTTTASKPDVSVIIPCYNAANTVSDTLESLQRQTCRNWEAVCIDDGSTDDTPQVLQSFAASDSRIRCARGPHKCPAAARNRGLSLATAEHALFLDADDLLMDPRALTTLLERARSAGDGHVTTGGYELLDAQGRSLSVFHFPTKPHFSVDSLLGGNQIPPMTMVPIATLGPDPFDDDPEKRGCEDWDLWLRLAYKGVGCAVVPRALFGYRLRADSLSHDPDRMFTSARRLIEKWSPRVTDRHATRDVMHKAACYFGAVACASGANDAIWRYFEVLPPLDPNDGFHAAVAGGIRHAFQCVRGAIGQTWPNHADEWLAESKTWLTDGPVAAHAKAIIEHLSRFPTELRDPVDITRDFLARNPDARRLLVYGLGTNGLTLLHRFRHQLDGLVEQLCIADDNADLATFTALDLPAEDPRRWPRWPSNTVAIITPNQPDAMTQTLIRAGGTDGTHFIHLTGWPMARWPMALAVGDSIQERTHSAAKTR